ncbi:MAG: TonB-dependent receptor [Paludibacter sp.]|nr:TonB-dependent receptor [Bacteroidales bacterium]MCM1069628.1 TonB-dependent receptor [Prevotella sp.]MCM1354274.1 TonB-dependent receptor [Bacteroides sp.]MCM1443113.1 TonB-dependent receptor [Muribaculum sp.]MCM1482348.1 TonB-dependent receptor [Paludibacter sp.]
MKHTHIHPFLLLAIVMLLVPSFLAAKPIEGKVTDAGGEPIIGATVISSNNKGTTTDFDGVFTLDITEGSSFTVSYMGYISQTKSVTSKSDFFSIILQEDTKILDDVVVIGYGTQKRSDVTGSISSVKTEDIADFSSKSLAESLSGMAAGVSITKGSGTPGEAADILIRGAGSINGMSPLYVVDGVAQDAGFNFNMRDVESIEILKDAGSAAIYGSQAAGGVILITTKRGKSEKTQVNVNARAGWRNIYSGIELLGTADWIRARDAWGNSSTLDLLGASSISELPNTNWMDVMFNTGVEQEYNISVSASSERTKFFLSAGYLDEKGTYMDTRAQRFSVRTNLDHTLGKHVSIGESVYGSMTKTNPATTSSIYNHTIPFRTVPVAEVYDADGQFAQTPTNVGSGPNFAGLEDAFHVFNDNNYALNLQAYLNVEFIKGLTWRTTGSANITAFSKNTFTEYREFGPVVVGVKGGTLNAYAGTTQRLMFNSVLTYEHAFGDHNLRLMAGTEWWKYDGYNLSVTAYDFTIPVAQSVALASAGATKDASDGLPMERRGSYFARVNYDYKGKYLIAANFRADASDRFVKKHRWGYFPSVNAGWRLSEEDFIKDYTGNWLSNAKIRGSWGILGNDNIAQFMYASTYSLSGISHAFDNTYTQQTGAWIAVLGNEDLKWEEVNQWDIGADFGFFNNRLTLTYDYYNRQTRDMLYRGSLPLTSGMSYYFSSDDPGNTVSVYFNAGLVENKGHEIALQWQDKKGDFTYSIGWNASFNQNLVKQVGDKPGASTIDRGVDNSWSLIARTEDGQPMSMFYGYEVLGIFQNQEQVDQYNQYALDMWRQQNPNHAYGFAENGQPLNAEGKPIGIYYQKENTGIGDLIYDDNGQGRVTAASRKYIGNPWPKMTMGLTFTFGWKGIDISAVFSGAFGFDIMNLVKPYTQMFSSDNTTADIFKTSCFGKDNTTVTDFPRVGYLDAKGSVIGDGAANKNYSTVSGYLVEKGDYFKLKNLAVGYTFPQKWTRKAKMEKARLYFSAQNLFTLTKYTGIDPEIGGNSLLYNVDTQNRYLPSRLFSFGLDITF